MRCCAGAVTLLLATLVAGTSLAEVAAPETTEVFVGTGETVPQKRALAHRFLLDRSETVIRGSRTLEPEIGYRLDSDAGSILLATPLAAGERLAVTYSWVPLDLPRDFVGLVREEPTPADSTRMKSADSGGISAADRIARAVDENLVIGGAKTFSIEVGSNRDAALEQSLRVSVTGSIGKDVRLTALLSDQNIPLQPEGNTQRLEELDEVLIRVEAPKGSATLGDFVAQRDGSAFGDFERRLSGAEARAAAGGATVRAVGASARGNFRSVEFPGQEEKQGPYFLAGDGQLTGSAVIVAGSERVWVDGQLLTRGENRDYVIDYSRGDLEFTNRRLITEDSEIAVDFEVSEQEYRRSFYLGEGSYATAGKELEWRVSIASEVDDKDPLNLTLSDERRAALEAAGDEAVLIPVLAGDACTDSIGAGDYEWVDDHFEYSGADSGTCRVSFTFLGAGQGDYVRDRDLDAGRTFYRFVGAGLGDFTAGVLLSAPRKATLADMSLRVRSGAGLELDVDGALSQEDRNTFSPVGDGNNSGAAGRISVAWEKKDLDLLGGPLRIRTSSSFRGEEAKFSSLGRNRAAYLGEVWNFADSTRADEAVGEARVLVERPGRWSVGGGFGIFDRHELFRSTRREGSATWTGRRISRASFRVESVRRENAADSLGAVVGDLLRERGEIVARFGAFQPGFTFWKEEREDVRGGARLAGEDDVEFAGTLAWQLSSSIRGSLRSARRTTDIVSEGKWIRESVARTYEAQSEISPGRSFRARLSWIRRELDFEESLAESDRTTHLTRSSINHENFGGLLSGEYVYETTSRTAADLLTGNVAEGEPTLALDASARIRLGAWRRRRGDTASFLSRALAKIRSETLLRVEEETTTPDRRSIYLLDFSRFQDDEHTIFGKFLLREEITLFPDASPFSLTARWERIDTEDNRADPARQETVTERRVLRARNRLGARWTLESQGSWQQDSRTDSRLLLSDFETRLAELEEELVWQPRPSVRASTSGAFVWEKNDTNGASIRAISIGVAASSAVLGKGRFRGDVGWTHPTVREGTDVGNRFRTRAVDQLDWRASLDLKVSDSINASVSYTGRLLENTPTTHLARAEARALF